MASNLKQNPTAKNGGLKTLQAQLAGVKLTNNGQVGNLPKLPTMKVVSKGAAVQYRQGVETLCTDLIARAEELGVLITDEDTCELQASEIENAERELCVAVNSIEIETTRKVASKVFFEAVLTQYPRTFTGLIHLVAVGCHLGFLVRKEDGGLKLPVIGKNDRWELVQMFCTHGKIAQAIEVRADTLREEREKEKEAELSALRKDVSSTDLLATIEHGGQCVVYCPPDPIRKFPGANVKVSVEDGMISLIDATGYSGKFVREFAETGMQIPVAVLGQEKLPKLDLEKEKFILFLKCHGLLRRGLAEANRKVERNIKLDTLKKRTTVTPEEFLLDGKTGIVHFYFKEWEDRRGGQVTMFKNLNFLVERNSSGEVKVLEDNLGNMKDLLFAECIGYKAQGEKFGGLAQPLSLMLRTLYAKYLHFRNKKAQGEVKTEQSASAEQEKYRQWVEAQKNAQPATSVEQSTAVSAPAPTVVATETTEK